MLTTEIILLVVIAQDLVAQRHSFQEMTNIENKKMLMAAQEYQMILLIM